MMYPKNPPGLAWDGWMFNEQIEEARKRAQRMAAPASVNTAVRELTPAQRRAYAGERQRARREDEKR